MPFSAIYFVLMYETYAQAVSIPAKTGLSISAVLKPFHKRALSRRRAADIASELHAGPVNLPKRLVTATEGGS